MQSKLTKTIIGAVIAIALAAAVSYGLISQQTADQIQTQANQTLQNDQNTASPAPPLPAPQNSEAAPVPNGSAGQNSAPAPRR